MVTNIFLTFLLLKALVETWLDHKNKNYILAHRDHVPAKFEEKITLPEHQKAADYSVTKIKMGQFFNFVNIIVLLGWTLGGGLNYLDQYIHKMAFSPLVHGVIFFAFFALISMLIGLPQSLYSTFVVEEKFGFNKMTPKLFVIDTLKGVLVGSIIGLPLVALILWIMQALGEHWWVYAWMALTTFQLVLLWAYPRFIAPIFNKFEPMQEGDVKEKVVSLLNRTGFTSNGLFVMNASIRSSHGNAYFTGFGKNKRIVFFDTLIKALEAGEVEAVLAHELGHFKRKHILKQLVRGITMSFIGFFILGKLVNFLPFFEGHGVAFAQTHMALILFTLVGGVYTFFLTPLSTWTSRKYEFEADTFAAENSDAQMLISALVKLYKDNASTLTPDPTYSAFYHSHPPALVRVQFLESLAK